MPLVFVMHYRENVTTFPPAIASVEIQATDQIFSPEEITNLVALAKKMNLDAGTFDVIREKESGDIYVVDVNNTPSEIPARLPEDKLEQALEGMSNAFIYLITNRL